MHTSRIGPRRVAAVVSLTCGLVLALLAAGPALAGASPSPPPQPAEGELGGDGPCGVSEPRVIENPAAVVNQSEPLLVTIFVPTGTRTRSPFVGGHCGKGAKPTVFFAHGYGVHDPGAYSRVITHWVSLGNVVVYADYEGNLTDPFDPATAQAFLEQTFRQVDIGNAAAVAAERRIDRGRVGFAGHSHGAGMTPYLTSRAAERGWGRHGLWMLDQSQAYTQLLGDDPIELPRRAQALVLAMDNDLFADNRNGIEVFEALELSERHKEHVTVHSQTRGDVVLDAGHDIPLDAAPADAMTYYGYYRQSDILQSCAMRHRDCRADRTFMGRWSDGVAVTPATATDDPVDSGPIPALLAECDSIVAALLNPRIANCPPSRP